ncbi:MAG: hypothetical protein ABW061_22790 [Polyangiaceae bacterium]
MSGAPPNYAQIAQRMLAQEAAGATTPSARALAAGAVQQRLHQRLVPLIGVEGVRALFARSVKVTSAEFPELMRLQGLGLGDAANFAKQLIDALQADEGRNAQSAAETLYANFLSLTATLIGERLVLMVLQRSFPTLDVAAKQESQ